MESIENIIVVFSNVSSSSVNCPIHSRGSLKSYIDRTGSVSCPISSFGNSRHEPLYSIIDNRFDKLNMFTKRNRALWLNICSLSHSCGQMSGIYYYPKFGTNISVYAILRLLLLLLLQWRSRPCRALASSYEVP
jgi:hypothetical protein